jgi:hypothetical protein
MAEIKVLVTVRTSLTTVTSKVGYRTVQTDRARVLLCKMDSFARLVIVIQVAIIVILVSCDKSILPRVLDVM